ncbi:autotransporter assembly complex family protein [Caenispirillum bisanense]|uniref:autotransporter assembly complex protein TamA n=1 Tax=Caenispirillum bisanense TaxID=414052 RepID=UPI0031CE85B8
MRDHTGRGARPRRLTAVALVVVAVFGLTGCGSLAFWDSPPPPGEGFEQADGGLPGPDSTRPMIPYEVDLRGVADIDEVEDRMLENGRLFRLQEDPPASILALQRRIDADLENFDDILRSRGYYAATMDARIDREATPVRVVIDITPGPRYRVGSFDITYAGGFIPPGAPVSIADLELEEGTPAIADDVLDQVAALPGELQRRGFPFARVADSRHVVNHDDRQLRTEVTLDTGPLASFGPLSVSGLTRVEEEYLHRLAPWVEGEQWDEEKVEAYRTALLGTGLFRSLQVGHPDDLGPDGRLPVEVEALEARHRTVGAGVRFSSDIGFGAKAYWEHRNLFGQDEDLRLSLTLSQLQQEVAANFQKPAWLRPDQTLVASVIGNIEDTDAYERTGATASVGIQRQFNELWRGGARVSLEFAKLKEREQEETTVGLIGFPVNVIRDSTDDRLNPTEGSVFAATLTPFAGASDTQALLFARAEASASAYWAPFDSDRLVLAARGATGTIVGEDLFDVPADKRFYAGGGGSVRGYQYQLLGPLDRFGDPTGGLSVIEANFEARIKVTDSIGIVPFIDGGQVFEARYPDFSEDILWAAGLGFRYYTGIGPLRLDVAVPLNARDDVDDAYQFYLSIGQAF